MTVPHHKQLKNAQLKPFCLNAEKIILCICN